MQKYVMNIQNQLKSRNKNRLSSLEQMSLVFKLYAMFLKSFKQI